MASRNVARSIYRKLRRNSTREILHYGPQYVRKQLLWAIRGRYHRWKLHANSERIRERRRAALDRLTEESTILFGCHGNICRSPFAERYTRQQLDAHGVDELDVASIGFIDNSHRQSPPEARATANHHGVTLASHSPRQAGAELLERADLILLKDYRNYHNFTTRFPDMADRMFLLGIFDDHPEIAIRDPYGESSEAFEVSYNRITASVDALLTAYTSRSADRPRRDETEQFAHVPNGR